MQLRTHIQPFKSVFDQVADGVLVLNAEGNVIYLNNSLKEIFKLAPGKKSAMNWKDFSTVDYCELVRKMETSFATLLSDFPMRMKGRKKELNLCVKSIEFDGNWMGCILIIRNPEYQDKEQKYMISHNPILRAINARRESSCFVLDVLTGRTLFVSESIERLTGWNTDLFTEGGLSFSFSMMHPRDAPVASEALFSWIKQKNQSKQIFDHIPLTVPFRFRDRSGHWLMFSTETNVLERDEEGKLRYLFGSYKVVATEPEVFGEISGIPGSRTESIRIIDGKTYINIDYLKAVQDTGITGKNTIASSQNAKVLSGREKEIIQLILAGLSSEEMSTKLFISKNTVNMHRKQIMKKLNAKNLVELVKIGIRDGLV